MSEYIAAPLSRCFLRQYALSIRKKLGLENIMKFPVLEFLEVFPYLIGDEDFYYEIVPDDLFPKGIHAQYDVMENCIAIKSSVYEGAVADQGRDRMTITHELSHTLIIKHSGIKVNRCFSGEKIITYQDPEWQAKCLAGELMIPANLVKGMSPNQVAADCGVSYQAAFYQLKVQEKEKR